ncbi:hypothetical protein Ddye_025020 [Dipteronia dyeriana]|uniref:Uncharacterized protein n=1 Tax=Dipteronia dyeriana TaxID=168575 RepID=A0AAD9TWF4_9ROSI|nr:hypothetical protein Ddye_025020 [Dipteronia dyeriana]
MTRGTSSVNRLASGKSLISHSVIRLRLLVVSIEVHPDKQFTNLPQLLSLFLHHCPQGLLNANRKSWRSQHRIDLNSKSNMVLEAALGVPESNMVDAVVDLPQGQFSLSDSICALASPDFLCCLYGP